MRKFLVNWVMGDNNRKAYVYEVYPGDGSMHYRVELQQRGVLIDTAGPFEFQADAQAHGRSMAWAPMPTLEIGL